MDGNLLEAPNSPQTARGFEPSTDTFKGPLVAEKEKLPGCHLAILELSSSARPPSVGRRGR